MTKKTFLKKLEAKLADLEESKRIEIIKKYENIIDEEIKNGKTEKEIITSLGSIDLIAKLYVSSNKSDSTKVEVNEEESDDSTSNNAIDNILSYIDDTFKNIDGELAKRILLLLCFIFIGILGLSLLHIPYKIIELIGTGIFGVIFEDYYFFQVVNTAWTFCLGICYLILIIWLIVKYIDLVVKYYNNGISAVKSENNTKTKVEAKKAMTESVKEEHIANKNESPFDIIFLILKVFVVLLTIPLLMTVAGLFMALFFTISLVINGVTLYGPIILLIGLISITTTLLDLIYRSLFKGGIK